MGYRSRRRKRLWKNPERWAPGNAKVGKESYDTVKTGQVGIIAVDTDYAGFDPATVYQFMDR